MKIDKSQKCNSNTKLFLYKTQKNIFSEQNYHQNIMVDLSFLYHGGFIFLYHGGFIFFITTFN